MLTALSCPSGQAMATDGPRAFQASMSSFPDATVVLGHAPG